jgi:hypothetical protein
VSKRFSHLCGVDIDSHGILFVTNISRRLHPTNDEAGMAERLMAEKCLAPFIFLPSVIRPAVLLAVHAATWRR